MCACIHTQLLLSVYSSLNCGAVSDLRRHLESPGGAVQRLSVLFRAERCCPGQGCFSETSVGCGWGDSVCLCHGEITKCLTHGRAGGQHTGSGTHNLQQRGGWGQPACRLPPQRITSLLVNVYFKERGMWPFKRFLAATPVFKVMSCFLFPVNMRLTSENKFCSQFSNELGGLEMMGIPGSRLALSPSVSLKRESSRSPQPRGTMHSGLLNV